MDMKLIALIVLVRNASFFIAYRGSVHSVSKYERCLDNKAVCLYDRGFVLNITQ